MADFYDQMDAAISDRKQSEEEADRLVEQLLAIATKLKKWKTEHIDPDAQLPTIRQVFDSKQKWLAAQRRAGEVLRNARDADEKTFDRLRQLHPEVEMDTSVRYRGRGQS